MPSSGVIAGKNIEADSANKALPDGYGVTMAALLPRDPNWMFIYWEITDNSKARIAREHGHDIFEKSKQVLRVHDLATAEGGENKHFDVPVMLEAKSWYVHVQDGGRAVWHCFVAGKKEINARLERALALGLYLGLSGLVTFEDQKPLRAVVPQIPDRHLVLDTDSPFLVPRPRTVERNEPAQCVRIAAEIAKLRGVTLADIARITTRNAAAYRAAGAFAVAVGGGTIKPEWIDRRDYARIRAAVRRVVAAV